MPHIEHLNSLEKAAVEVGGDFSCFDETYGFSVRPGRMRRRRAVMVEWAAQYMAFLAIFTTIGAVAGATSLSGRGLDLFEVGFLVLGLSVAVSFFWIGLRGTAQELQIDMRRRELRVVMRNYRGAERVIEAHGFSSVESVFIHRRSQHSRNGGFTVRTKAEPNGVVLLGGSEKALSNLHIVVTRLMHSTPRPARTKSRAIFHRPAEERVEESLAM